MRIATLKTLLIMSFFLLIAAYTAAGKVIYVDADAQGPVYDGSSWEQDAVTSPCIDAGDIKNPLGLELFPNGGIVNMGVYGRPLVGGQ